MQAMHDWVRKCIAACLYYSGLISLIRWWRQRSGHSLTILYYHRAAGGYLRSHLLYLRRHYRILHLETALKELYAPHKEEVQRRDGRTLLAVTFDDGYYDNYTVAFTLAQELQVPITIFLIPGYMESGNSFWWADRLVRLARVGHTTVDGRSYDLNRQGDCKALAQAIDAHVSHAGSTAEREEFLACVCKILAMPPSAVPKEEPAQLLNWAQVREMEESGWVAFGAHTMHHPDLANLADPAEMQREVGECRMMLEQRLGHLVGTFAYPFGHVGDNGFRALKQAGYNWAVTTVPGFNTRQSDPYLLRRRNASVNQHWLIVAAETAGVWNFFSRFKKMIAGFLIRKHRML